MHEAKTFCMPRRTGRTRGFSIPAGSFLVTIRFILEIVLYILQKNNYSSVGVLASSVGVATSIILEFVNAMQI